MAGNNTYDAGSISVLEGLGTKTPGNVYRKCIDKRSESSYL